MASEQRMATIARVVAARQGNVALVIEDVHDPHNAEAIFRTCDAFGIQDVYLIFDKEKAWNPTKIGKSSSSSAHKWLTFHIFRSTEECFRVLKEKGYTLAATSLADSATSLYETRFPSSVALLVGNEHSGLSSYALKHADMHVRIPMRGMVESLNVSVATALFLSEITRQRVASNQAFGLSSNDQTRLVEDFSVRSSKRNKRG